MSEPTTKQTTDPIFSPETARALTLAWDAGHREASWHLSREIERLRGWLEVILHEKAPAQMAAFIALDGRPVPNFDGQEWIMEGLQ